MEIYVVTYVSRYDGLYFENKCFADEEQAYQCFQGYLEDIAETEKGFDPRYYMDSTRLSWVSPIGHEYMVEMNQETIR